MYDTIFITHDFTRICSSTGTALKMKQYNLYKLTRYNLLTSDGLKLASHHIDYVVDNHLFLLRLFELLYKLVKQVYVNKKEYSSITLTRIVASLSTQEEQVFIASERRRTK